ncbi:MAG: IS110 family transposase [Gammaproteobacteria bacterium]|nr:IS110 family transposase [Gammaproteobacteria bacterium]
MISIGIDVSKATIDCVFINNDKKHYRKFNNDAEGFKGLIKWIKPFHTFDETLFCMEATGIYHLALAKFLFDLEANIIVANPIKTHHFAKLNMSRNKTDKSDALLIAMYSDYLMHNDTWQQSLWQPKTQEFEDLQYLITRLDQLAQQKYAEQNRLAIATNKRIVKSIKQMIKYLDKQIDALTASITDLVKSSDSLNKSVELLKTINGVGAKTAWSILAYTGDMSDFENANQITSFAGLNPQQKQSGTSVNSTSLSKMGHRKLRKTLFMPALVAIRHNPVLKAFYQRLLARGKAKMVAVAAIMRKLLVLCFGVLKSGVAFDANYGK